MIIEALFRPIFAMVVGILSILPSLPDIPATISNGIDTFLNLIFNNVGLLGIFVPIDTIKVVIPLAIAIANFDHIYKFFIWIINKVPNIDID